MFLKYLEISKPWKKKVKSLKKNSDEAILVNLQAFRLLLFKNINIYAGRFQDSTFFKKRPIL